MPTQSRIQAAMRAARAARSAQRSMGRGIAAIAGGTAPNTGGRYYRNKSRRSKWRSTAQIKKVIRSQTETKRVDYANAEVGINHNGGPTANILPWSYMFNNTVHMPTQGTGDSNREGNDIYGVGWTVRMQFRLPSDRLNTKFRLLFMKVPKGYNPSSNYSQWADPVTSNCMIDPPDKDRVTIIKDTKTGLRNINPGVPTTGKEVTWYKTFFIPCKKVIRFWDDGLENNNQLYDYYLLVYAYDSAGTLVTDVVGYVRLWSRFTFKDK